MRLSISSWSFHSLFLNNVLSAEEFPRVVKQSFGIQAVEYFEGDLCEDVHTWDESRVDAVAKACHDAGVTICAISARNDLMTFNDSAAFQDVERIRRWIDLAPRLGHKTIRINTGLRRPTAESLNFAKERLRPLLERATNAGVILAVENHPHIVRNDQDLDLLIQFLEEMSAFGLASCPDTGAFAADLAVLGFRALARFAAHVHVKAPVVQLNQKDSELSDYYSRFVDPLKDRNYDGYLSIEYVETDDFRSDPANGTLQAASAIGKLIGQQIAPRRLSHPSLTPADTDSVDKTRIPKCSLDIVEKAIPLMAEGCERRLGGAAVHIWTFVENRRRKFGSACCRLFADLLSQKDSSSSRYADDGFLTRQCRRFYDYQAQQVEQGRLRRDHLCLCPLGLAVLVVPLQRDGQLYGAVVCGGWRESGTEGAVIYGIDRWLPSENAKQRTQEVLDRIPELTPDELRKAHDTLRDATNTLGELFVLAHHEQRLEHQNEVVQQFIEKARGQAARTTVEAINVLQEALARATTSFDGLYTTLYIADVAQPSEKAVFRPLGSLAAAPSAVPKRIEVPFERLKNTPSSDPSLLDALVGAQPPKPEFVYVDRLVAEGSYVMLLFSGPPIRQTDLKNSLERIARHVVDVLRTAHVFDEAHEGRERIELLADRTRHLLNGPLQGIRGACGRLRSLLEKRAKGLSLARGADSPRVREIGGDNGGSIPLAFPDDTDIQDLAERIDTYTRDAAQVVDRLSRAALKKAAKHAIRPLTLTSVDLARVIERAVDPFVLSASERGVTVHVGPSVQSLPPVQCDAKHIEAVFANLVENAVKFSHNNRVVHIYGRQALHYSTAGARPLPAVAITVSDFGLGIPEEDRERIFEKYTQSSVPDVRRSISGTGLGLYVARDIVRRHHGNIEVEVSTPSRKPPFAGIGARASLSKRELFQGCKVEFTVTLPISQEGL